MSVNFREININLNSQNIFHFAFLEELWFGKMAVQNAFHVDVIPGQIAEPLDLNLKAMVTVWPF